MGWRKPCYPLADEHVEHVAELFDKDLWDNYGVGQRPALLELHDALAVRVGDHLQRGAVAAGLATLIKSGAAHKGGITAA